MSATAIIPTRRSQLASQPINGWQCGQRAQNGEASYKKWMEAPMQPFAQQHVVQRHVRLTPPQQTQQIVPAQLCDFHTAALIKPERFPVDKQKAQSTRAGG